MSSVALKGRLEQLDHRELRKMILARTSASRATA
jgi:hypothetical protein